MIRAHFTLPCIYLGQEKIVDRLNIPSLVIKLLWIADSTSVKILVPLYVDFGSPIKTTPADEPSLAYNLMRFDWYLRRNPNWYKAALHPTADPKFVCTHYSLLIFKQKVRAANHQTQLQPINLQYKYLAIIWNSCLFAESNWFLRRGGSKKQSQSSVALATRNRACYLRLHTRLRRTRWICKQPPIIALLIWFHPGEMH